MLFRSALWAVAPIEVAARRGIPPANFIVATLHRRDCSLKFDLRTDEIPATGGHRFFAHFDSPGHCKSMLPGFCFSCGFSAFFRSATSRVAACRQDTDFRLKKTTSGTFRKFPVFSALKMSTLKFSWRNFAFNPIFSEGRAISSRCESRTPGWWPNFAGWTQPVGSDKMVAGKGSETAWRRMRYGLCISKSNNI